MTVGGVLTEGWRHPHNHPRILCRGCRRRRGSSEWPAASSVCALRSSAPIVAPNCRPRSSPPIIDTLGEP